MSNEHEKDVMLLLETVKENIEKGQEVHDPFLDLSASWRDNRCHHHHFQKKHNSGVTHQVRAQQMHTANS